MFFDQEQAPLSVPIRRIVYSALMRPETFITKKEVALRLRCTVRTVDNLIRSKAIPSTKIGRLRRFDWSRICTALEKFTTKAIGEV